MKDNFLTEASCIGILKPKIRKVYHPFAVFRILIERFPLVEASESFQKRKNER